MTENSANLKTKVVQLHKNPSVCTQYEYQIKFGLVKISQNTSGLVWLDSIIVQKSFQIFHLPVFLPPAVYQF
jgi:hypothetical protein